MPGEIRLQIDCGNGELVSLDPDAAALLGIAAEDASGRPWRELLGEDKNSRLVLNHALACARQVYLPPILVRSNAGDELILGGVVLPRRERTPQLAELLLWQVLDSSVLAMERTPKSGDALAVLGVDQLRYDDNTAPEAIAALMSDLRGSLLEIVRSDDAVSSPLGNALVIVLRAVDAEGARAISGALLSHLHRLLKQQQGLAASARLRVGIAHIDAHRSVMSTLLAANASLSLALTAGEGVQVRLETDEDSQLMIAAAINQGGALAARTVAVPPEQAAEEAVPIKRAAPPVQPIEKDIDGYVVDNMEGAVDQALFLAHLDIPVAIVGPAGTGKMYVARVMHDATGAPADLLVSIDCREFRGRKEADRRISSELERGAGVTLVFKSPHLLHVDVQRKLARQISTRTLADASPPRALPKMKFIALFPQALDQLQRKGQLSQPLASAFAGYPITVPPIKDRKQAVLRWAHKILGQEGALRDRDMRGFTPDAEQAMLLYEWPGNISEMRQCISDAMDKTDKDWLTPVDLGLFEGIDPEGEHYVPESRPFLVAAEAEDAGAETLKATALESLDVALGQAVRALLELDLIKPLGTWLDDDLVQASLERYRGDVPKAAKFLHTRSRNISRWLPKIDERDEERGASALWQTPRRLVREWVREVSQMEDSPMDLLQLRLLAHIEEQAGALGTGRKAKILGVSTPTYSKRVREMRGT